ncbi:MAG: heme-degrading domain-containing protein [Rhizobiaceae bacterium]|nr:heme-degrading domain-containing protein [Rhizobiaceae bacterium]
MTIQADIDTILAQEKALVFPSFSEADAFALGCHIVRLAQSRGLGVFVDIRLWDRVLFTHAMAGTTSDNEDWVRRKVNVVRRFHCASYRKGLEMKRDGKAFGPASGTNDADYAPHGGGFPIRLADGPVIGCVTVSNLPQREDHKLGVEAIALHLGLDPADFAMD